MYVVKGERIDTKTLMCLGFEKGEETNNEQVWYCGKTMVGLSKTTTQNPLVLWLVGHIGYIGNAGLGGIVIDKRKHNYLKLPPSRVKELLKGVSDGRYFAKRLFGY